MPLVAATVGPTLEQYLETRFNLLDKRLDEKIYGQHEALMATVEAAKLAAVAVALSAEAARAATDLRYQQRFDAQSDALAAAFASQQTAMKVAFDGAEKAVNAALAAADRAVSKAELASDKRFESVNEFRKTLADQQATFMPRAEADVSHRGMNDKIEAMKQVLDRMIAEQLGVKGGWGYAVGVVGFVLAVGAVILMAFKFIKGGP